MQINNYHRIPAEMRPYRQWLCWRFEQREEGKKPTKVPYQPTTGKLASVTDPSTWCSYEEAVWGATAEGSPYDGIGFVLTKQDPYTFIDLDDTGGNQAELDRQIKIFREFDSYSERSPSGTGLHIITRGHAPTGRRRAHIEIYSAERYMTMTGDVFNDTEIQPRQQLIQMLWGQMGGEHDTIQYHDGNAPQTMDDAALIERALSAVNGEKFRTLLEGRWKELYSSQSEADFAFIDIIAFYTQNAQQISRVFRASPLGQRDKASRDNYVMPMIRRSFDNLLPKVDIAGVENNWEAAAAKAEQAPPAPPLNAGTAPAELNSGTPAPEAKAGPAPQSEIKKFWQPVPISPPPGLLGEIAHFIFNAAPRPVAETAITAAIGLLAGITGRAYNISGTGLNQYLLLLAPTGTGKEAIAGGINRLLQSIRTSVPASAEFLGPAEFSSGQALAKTLTRRNPCFVSIVGEFGYKMQQLANPRASTSEIMLKRVLLDLFNKSGKNDVFGEVVSADKDKNSVAVNNPSVTILGESTPETFYAATDEHLIADGLLPRFMVIEYTGPRPKRNKNHHEVVPSLPLVERLAEISQYSMTLQHNQSVINVDVEPDALAFLDRIDELVDETINSTETDALRHLWNRAHIKTLKLAALVAVGCDFLQPKITLEHAQWALNVVTTDIFGIVNRFTRGEIGKNTSENKQSKLVLDVLKDYLTKNYAEVKGYGVDEKIHRSKIIPYSYVSRRIRGSAPFQNDRMGATHALKRVMQGLIDSGDIQEVGKQQLLQEYSFSGRGFVISHPDKLSAAMK